MRPRNFFLVFLTLSAVAGIASIYPQSQWSALIDVKKAAAQSACQNLQGDTPSEEKIITKERPLVYIAWYLAAVGQYDQALKMVDKMTYCGFRDLALVEVVGSLAKEGQIDRAMQLFNSIRSQEEKGFALARVADNLVRAGQYDPAMKLVNIIKSKSGQYRVVERLANSLAQAGQIDRALQLASTSKRYVDKAEVLGNITRSLAQAGKYDRAKKVASTMEGPLKDLAFVDVAASLAEAGKIADAVQIVSSIEERAPFPDYWFSETVMLLAYERKKYEPALEMANAIRDENQKAWTLAQLANELIKAGQTELASQAIKPALEIVGFEQMVRP